MDKTKIWFCRNKNYFRPAKIRTTRKKGTKRIFSPAISAFPRPRHTEHWKDVDKNYSEDKKLQRSITFVIFNETKNFFDQNFSFYNWSKHNNLKGHTFGGRASFFVYFFCRVRRYPKTGFRSFKKKFLCILVLPTHSEV